MLDLMPDGDHLQAGEGPSVQALRAPQERGVPNVHQKTHQIFFVLVRYMRKIAKTKRPDS
jgi:hypothetical protein